MIASFLESFRLVEVVEGEVQQDAGAFIESNLRFKFVHPISQLLTDRFSVLYVLMGCEHIRVFEVVNQVLQCSPGNDHLLAWSLRPRFHSGSLAGSGC